ncbi:DUF3175 domain-containing protein [Cupriavidus sp. 30B13]|uniref:DUF3175 domain-containing protein n=1 Tax=Cupriavidus sp. 30B13 TaxID=3384241 RepID=UPI003B908F66
MVAMRSARRAARRKPAGARRAGKKGSPARQAAGRGKAKAARRWSQRVTEHSDALDLQADIFKSGSAAEIAASLKRSALHSRRRKGTPFQSAMSMLNFYINRAGRQLPKARRATLEQAKRKLREAFGRPA